MFEIFTSAGRLINTSWGVVRGLSICSVWFHHCWPQSSVAGLVWIPRTVRVPIFAPFVQLCSQHWILLHFESGNEMYFFYLTVKDTNFQKENDKWHFSEKDQVKSYFYCLSQFLKSKSPDHTPHRPEKIFLQLVVPSRAFISNSI